MAWAGSQGQSSPGSRDNVSSCFMTSCVAWGLQGLHQGLDRYRLKETRTPSPKSPLPAVGGWWWWN